MQYINLHAYTYIQAFLNIKEEYEGPYLVSTSSITLPPPPPPIAPLQTQAQTQAPLLTQTQVVGEGVVASVSTESIVLEEMDYCDIEADATATAATTTTLNNTTSATSASATTVVEGQQYTNRPMLRGVILLHVTEGDMTARFHSHDNIPTRASLLL